MVESNGDKIVGKAIRGIKNTLKWWKLVVETLFIPQKALFIKGSKYFSWHWVSIFYAGLE